MKRRAAALVLAALVVGCGSPDAANIELRKRNQQLQDQLAAATGRADRADAATAAAEAARPTAPTLPPDRLARLFTVHGLQFGRLTGADPDAAAPQLKAYVVPVDDAGTPIKAAGAFTVEAFDLAAPQHPLVGAWRFPLGQARTLFYDQFALYTYVLPCPWGASIPRGMLTLRVTFTDELTGRVFTAQTQVTVPPGR